MVILLGGADGGLSTSILPAQWDITRLSASSHAPPYRRIRASRALGYPSRMATTSATGSAAAACVASRAPARASSTDGNRWP